MAGLEDEFKGVLGTAITKICALTAARAGLTVSEAQKAGYEVVSAEIKSSANAGYYPGGGQYNIKLRGGKNMSIGIVTDSTCDLSSEVIENYDLEMIPLIVNFGEKSYQDKASLTSDQFFEKLTPGEDFPETSQPPIGDFIDCYQRLADDYETLLSIHLSSELSGAYNTAKMAAQQAEEVEVKVFDSASISIGLGFLVLLAAELARQGYDAEEIVSRLEKARERLKLYFTEIILRKPSS